MIARFVCLIAALMALGGCRLGDPRTMTVSFSAYTDRPVVLTKMVVNGFELGRMPMVVRGRADVARPSDGGGRSLLTYPSGTRGEMTLDFEWVMLPSGEAYSAQVTVPLSGLQASASGGVEFMPVFGPDGLLIIAADPLPATADATETVDAARLCGTRAPDADFDYTAEPRSLPALFEALESATTEPATSECS